MSNLLTEQDVLKKLDIVDFSELSIDNIKAVIAMADKMDPEVARKVFEQFPEFTTATKGVLNEYKDTLNQGLETNRESTQNYYDACNTIIESLQKQVDNDNLSIEEKKYIFEEMKKVANMIGEKDSENKIFIYKMAATAGSALFLTVIAVAALWGKGKTNKVI
jgi:hypothetical protein